MRWWLMFRNYFYYCTSYHLLYVILTLNIRYWIPLATLDSPVLIRYPLPAYSKNTSIMNAVPSPSLGWAFPATRVLNYMIKYRPMLIFPCYSKYHCIHMASYRFTPKAPHYFYSQ